MDKILANLYYSCPQVRWATYTTLIRESPIPIRQFSNVVNTQRGHGKHPIRHGEHTWNFLMRKLILADGELTIREFLIRKLISADGELTIREFPNKEINFS